MVVQRHRQRFVIFPLAQSLLSTYYSQSLTLAQLRCTHHKAKCTVVCGRLHWLRLKMVDAVGESTAVEVRVIGHCIPAVVDGVVGSCIARKVEHMLHRLPFATLN